MRAGSRRERLGEVGIVAVTLLLMAVLFACIQHAIVTSPGAHAPPGRMVFVPPPR